MGVESSKILLVDDCEVNNKILYNIFKQSSLWEIIVKKSAEEALDYLEVDQCEELEGQPPIDLIITDMMMPGLNGLEFAKKLNKCKRYHQIPIIMLTASSDMVYSQEVFNSGIVDFILKPVKKDILLTKIYGILKLREKFNELYKKEQLLSSTYHKVVDDLKVAIKLQRQILPNDFTDENLTINGIYMPYEFLGGDLYYWQKIDKNCYGVILLDVMGHGTATSLICMYIRSVLPELMRENKEPTALIQALNQVVIDFNNQLTVDSYHCTAFYMMIDSLSMKIKYVNAGNPYVAYINKNQDIQWLERGCLPLGIFDDFKIEYGQENYSEDTQILLYSDGIYELLNQKSLSLEYMINYVRLYGNMDVAGTIMLDKLYRLIEQIPRNDDVSLVYIDFSAKHKTL